MSNRALQGMPRYQKCRMGQLAKKKTIAGKMKEEAYAYPSRYGSHTKMLVLGDSLKDTSYELPENFVVCEDENGKYITEVDRLDDGLADPNRNAPISYRQAQLAQALNGV